MWLKPGGRALRFEAVEEFAVDEVAFSWRARFPIVPLVSLRVLDRYAAGEGQLEARLFGFPLMRARGQATAEGEAMRYLAELPWVPQAMAVNRQLEWRELDRQTVEVATRVGPTRVAVRARAPKGRGLCRGPGVGLRRLRRARRHPRSAVGRARHGYVAGARELGA